MFPISHNNMVHEPIPIAKAMTTPKAKTAPRKQWQKLLAWGESKVTSKAEVIRRANLEDKKVHFGHFTGPVSFQELRSGEEVPKVQRKSGIEKHDSKNNFVFTEQSASASHMKAARVLDVITRLPGCSGKARPQNWDSIDNPNGTAGTQSLQSSMGWTLMGREKCENMLLE